MNKKIFLFLLFFTVLSSAEDTEYSKAFIDLRDEVAVGFRFMEEMKQLKAIDQFEKALKNVNLLIGQLEGYKKKNKKEPLEKVDKSVTFSTSDSLSIKCRKQIQSALNNYIFGYIEYCIMDLSKYKQLIVIAIGKNKDIINDRSEILGNYGSRIDNLDDKVAKLDTRSLNVREDLRTLKVQVDAIRDEYRTIKSNGSSSVGVSSEQLQRTKDNILLITSRIQFFSNELILLMQHQNDMKRLLEDGNFMSTKLFDEKQRQLSAEMTIFSNVIQSNFLKLSEKNKLQNNVVNKMSKNLKYYSKGQLVLRDNLDKVINDVEGMKSPLDDDFTNYLIDSERKITSKIFRKVCNELSILKIIIYIISGLLVLLVLVWAILYRRTLAKGKFFKH